MKAVLPRRLTRGGLAGLTLAMVVAPCLLAEFVDGLRSVEPYAMSWAPDLSPSLSHPLGTDPLGRDSLSRLLHGGRVSILVSVFGGVLASALGTLIGVLAGYRGGFAESVLMRVTETFMALPKLPLMLLLAAVDVQKLTGIRPGATSEVLTLMVIIGLFTWMDVARVARAATRSIRTRDFVLAAEGLGRSPLAVLWIHILPHLRSPLSVAFAIDVGQNVLYESALSFLGLGVSPPTPSWGALLAQGLMRMQDAPLLVVVPGALTLALVASVHVLAEDLRARTDPASARLERG